MKFIGGFALSLLAYFAIDALLLTLAHGVSAPASSPFTGASDPLELALDLGAQAMACLAAGLLALAPRGATLKVATFGAGLPLFLITCVTTFAWWAHMPTWYNLTLLAVTWPFFILGAAWRASARQVSRGVA